MTRAAMMPPPTAESDEALCFLRGAPERGPRPPVSDQVAPPHRRLCCSPRASLKTFRARAQVSPSITTLVHADDKQR